jgi:prepilin-type N-terminal cleavage/methylation domain-containing protein
MSTTALPPRRAPRAGFSLIEVMVALVILSVIALGVNLGTARFTRTVADSTLRTRAQALADAQIAMARSWPTYSTLNSLTGPAFNGGVTGLTRTTAVAVDTTGGRNVSRVTVTVRSVVTGALTPDVVRSITIAAP